MASNDTNGLSDINLSLKTLEEESSKGGNKDERYLEKVLKGEEHYTALLKSYFTEIHKEVENLISFEIIQTEGKDHTIQTSCSQW